MVKPFPCIFDVALDLSVHGALGGLKRRTVVSFPPTTPLTYFISICLHSCFSQSGPWLTFNSALTDTGRRLSKRRPSSNEMWISPSHQRIGYRRRTHEIPGRGLFNELRAVWLNTAMSLTSPTSLKPQILSARRGSAAETKKFNPAQRAAHTRRGSK